MKRFGVGLLFLLAAGEIPAAVEEEVELLALPSPALERIDPAVGQKLQAARDQVENLAGQSGAAPQELAAAYGSLGQLYLLYGLEAEAEVCFHNAGILDPRESRWPYYRAVIFQGSGRLEESREALSRYLGLRPGDPAASLRAGQVALEMTDLETAKVLFNQASLSPGTAAAARYGLGQIALLEGRVEAAVEHYEAVLADQPEASTAHYQLGLALRELGDLEKARAHLALHGQRGVSFSDPLMSTLRSGSTGAALHVVDGALARSRGDYPAAIASFRRALAENPDDLPVKLSLASSLGQIGARDESLELFREVLGSDPSNASAHYNVGTLLAQSGDLRAALEHLEQAVAGAPDFASAHVSLAAVLARLRRFEAAETHYARALELDPANTRARTQRVAVLMSLDRTEEAEEELRQVLAREPERVEAWMALTRILQTTGRLAPAYDALTRVAELTDDAAEALRIRMMLAQMAVQAQRSEDAIAHLEVALELGGDPSQIHSRLARLLGEAGRYEEAADHFAAVVEAEPSDEEARFGRALALLYGERYRQAKDHLEESLLALPDSASLGHLLARLLATCPEDALRDGQRALALIQQIMEREQRPEYAETLAMAWAEVGSFDQAVEIQQWLVARATQDRRDDLLPDLRRRLSLYQKSLPCRAPWLGTADSRRVPE